MLATWLCVWPPSFTALLPASEEASACAASLPGGAVGEAFVQCMRRRLPDVGTRHFWELVRNASCAQDDDGTPPVRRSSITVDGRYDECADEEAAARGPPRPATQPPEFLGGAHPDFVYIRGFLMPGNDLYEAGAHPPMTAGEAAEVCLADDACDSFTFRAAGPGRSGVFFKRAVAEGGGVHRAPDWHTYRRRRPRTCPASSPEEARTLAVDVLREQPLVAVIRNFATRETCDALVRAGGGWEEMARSHTSDGGPSHDRRSYSSRIEPPLWDPGHPITRVVAEMFAITRNLSGYAVYPRGQEPVNAVLYRHVGDEYRLHCDGRCYDRDNAYRLGERVATSIVYCHLPEKGGQTSFTVGALKVQPIEGDMLLFAYKGDRDRMVGLEAEHSGCPIRQGQKWIATQWYREGVSDAWNWQEADAAVDDDPGDDSDGHDDGHGDKSSGDDGAERSGAEL